MTPRAPDSDLLHRIADDRRRHVQEMKLRLPGYELRARLGHPEPAGRLERRLRRGGAGNPLLLLCDVVGATPARGVLREDVDPVAIAREFERGGAAAVSLTTEPDHFRGDPAWVNAVRAALTVSILMKDVVVDSYQLLDAAWRGADGVVLAAALLSEVQLQRLIGESRLLGLDCLVEAGGAAELASALRAGATLVSVGHRDPRTLAVDVPASLALLPQVPPLVTAVVECGQDALDEVWRLRETRCDAALVGEWLMSDPDPAAALARLAGVARG